MQRTFKNNPALARELIVETVRCKKKGYSQAVIDAVMVWAECSGARLSPTTGDIWVANAPDSERLLNDDELTTFVDWLFNVRFH